MTTTNLMGRRSAIGALSSVAAVAPLGSLLVGCSDSGDESSVESETGSTMPISPPVAWATGGTASISAPDVDPFEEENEQVCQLTCSQILGPCQTPIEVRADISEGVDGLPMRFKLRVVDEACNPIEGAVVDVWHTSPSGLYSGEDADPFCTLDDEEAVAGHWFRGKQVSDASGQVAFLSCFPGWYAGRAIHIHVQIIVGDTEYLTTQLYFEDTLIDDILRNEELYSNRGERDTRNDVDAALLPAELPNFILSTQVRPDGALLAYKTLSIRSSAEEELCSTQTNFPAFPPPDADPEG